MIDISGKGRTLRTATARAAVKIGPGTAELIASRRVPKGDPFEVAKVAAVMAAKNTSTLIPYCHPVALTSVAVDCRLEAERIDVEVSVKAVDRTGVEMEALTAAAAASLTLYDMLKMLDQGMEILSVRLVEKRGGKGDFRDAFPRPLRAAVLVASDSTAAGRREDASGAAIAARLEREGITVVERLVVPDDRDEISRALVRFADELELDLVFTTGGTGCGPRDNTPEATCAVLERRAPGIAEAIRLFGQERTPRAMLSRGAAGVRGRTLMINLPGSERGVSESLDALFPGVLHAFTMIRGEGHPEPGGGHA